MVLAHACFRDNLFIEGHLQLVRSMVHDIIIQCWAVFPGRACPIVAEYQPVPGTLRLQFTALFDGCRVEHRAQSCYIKKGPSATDYPRNNVPSFCNWPLFNYSGYAKY